MLHRAASSALRTSYIPLKFKSTWLNSENAGSLHDDQLNLLKNKKCNGRGIVGFFI